MVRASRLRAALGALAVGSILTCPPCDAQCQQATLTASDAAATDYFGSAVAISGDYAVVGSPNDDRFGIGHLTLTDAGAAYVYHRSGGAWTQQAKLVATDDASSDHFGASVAIYGTTVVVGAPGDNSDRGGAYVFILSGGVWSQQAKLVASDGTASDQFGLSVAISPMSIIQPSGTRIAVGAPYEDTGGTDAGAVYTYTRASGGTTWTQEQKVQSTDVAAGDGLGSSVSLDLSEMIAGAPGESRTNLLSAGAAYVFRRSATWTQEAKVVSPIAQPADLFGRAVAIDGDYVVVGAPYADTSGVNALGTAFIYHRSGTAWPYYQTLLPDSTSPITVFGYSVAIQGLRVVVSGLGEHAAEVYELVSTIWIRESFLTDPTDAASSVFGQSVALSGNDLLVGDPGETIGGQSDAGAAYTFKVGLNGFDSCGLARAVGAGTFVGCTIGATSDGSASCAPTTGSPDVWYKFVPSGCGTVRFDTVGSSFDAVLSIHSGCPGAGTVLACDDDSAGSQQARIDYIVTSGTPYYVRVAGYAGASGLFTLNIAEIPPVNDVCASATVVGGGSFVGTTCRGTADGASTCGAAGPDAWYAYTAPCSGNVQFDTNGSSINTVLSIHSACPGTTGNQLRCDDDSGAGNASLVSMAVTAGTTYYVRVVGSGGAAGPFALNITGPLPPNDNCADAIAIGPGPHPFSTCFATTDGPSTVFCAPIGGDIWFRYTPPHAGPVAVGLCGSTFDTVVEIYADTCPVGIGVFQACNDNFCGAQSRVAFSASGFSAYKIRVGGRNGAEGSGTLMITCPADWDTNGVIEPQDVSQFVSVWYAALTSASLVPDFDGNGLIEPADISMFVNAWYTAIINGCP